MMNLPEASAGVDVARLEVVNEIIVAVEFEAVVTSPFTVVDVLPSSPFTYICGTKATRQTESKSKTVRSLRKMNSP